VVTCKYPPREIPIVGPSVKYLLCEIPLDRVVTPFELVQTAVRERLNTVEKAIRLLELEYRDRLTLDEFDDAIEVLENKFKASAFVSLRDITIRDRWLRKNVGAELKELRDKESI
jgi:hypothetical protein